jgi:hypothetical protein
VLRISNSNNLIDSVARFLETRGMFEDALNVATDPDYKFELAVQLGKLDVAKVIFFYFQSVICKHVLSMLKWIALEL